MCDGDCCHCCNGGGEVWTPSLLPPSQLTYWFKADAGVTLGTGVAAWADQSGNGNHVSQAVGVNQPAYTPNYRNGLPGIVFDGINDSLRRATLTQGAINTPYRRYVVYRRPSPITAVPRVMLSNANALSHVYLEANTYRSLIYNAPNPVLAIPSVPAALSFNIVNALFNTVGSSIRNIQSGGLNQVTSGTTGSNQAIGVTIGSLNGTTAYFASGICEVLAVPLNTPVGDNLIMTYLQDKWGIYP